MEEMVDLRVNKDRTTLILRLESTRPFVVGKIRMFSSKRTGPWMSCWSPVEQEAEGRHVKWRQQ
jgi:hypothetical protein